MMQILVNTFLEYILYSCQQIWLFARHNSILKMEGMVLPTLNITSPPSTAALHPAPTEEEFRRPREGLSEGWLPQTRILNPS